MSATVRGLSGLVTSGTTLSISETSASPQAGDVRYVFINVSSSATITPPSGWTALSNGVVGAGTLGVFSKPWVSGVGTENFTVSASSQIGAQAVAVTGVNQTLTPQVATNGSGTAGTALSTTSITPAVSAGLLLAYFAVTLSTGATTGTLSTPTGLTLQATHPGAASASYVILTGSEAITSTASTGSFTSTASGSGTWRTAALLIPSTTAGGPTATLAFLSFLGSGGSF